MNEGINNLCNTIAGVIKVAVVLGVLGVVAFYGYGLYVYNQDKAHRVVIHQAKIKCESQGARWDDNAETCTPAHGNISDQIAQEQDVCIKQRLTVHEQGLLVDPDFQKLSGVDQVATLKELANVISQNCREGRTQ